MSIVCLTSCYTVTLALELSRLIFRSGLRGALMIGFATLGLVIHTILLTNRAMESPATPLASAYDWYLVAAWVLVVMYLMLTFYYPRAGVGLFVMPLVLSLVGAARLSSRVPSLTPGGAAALWGYVHGVTLLLGTVAVLIGFVAGVMYLLQARRLKLKKLGDSRFQFPSLERLQRVNANAIVMSAIMLGLGFLSGTIGNVISKKMAWSDPVVWSTTLMFVWQVAVVIFSLIYKAAREGRKVAYLTIANFLFLVIALATYVVGH
jgi:ABC-type uncharacterized transport system permease subunit